MRARTLGVVGLVVASGLMWLGWGIYGDIGLIIAGFASLLGGLVVFGHLVRRLIDRSVANTVSARDELTREIGVVGNQVSDLTRSVDDVAQKAERIDRRMRDRARLLDEVVGTLSSLSERLTGDERGGFAHASDVGELRELVKRELHRAERARHDLFRQVESLIALDRALAPHALVGTRGWAASPDVLWFLYTEVRSRSPELVVECGSGMSTVVIASALRGVGHGTVISLEHDREFMEATTRLLSRHDLVDWAEVRLAPLESTEVDGEQRPWYRLEAVPEESIDILFVDGPPGRVHEMARLPAFPLLEDRLGPDALIVLDDYDRAEERRVVEHWLESSPEWTLEVLDHEKGTAVLRRSTGA